MISTITKEWTFTTAQTDLLIETVGAAQRAKIYGAIATTDGANTVNVSLRIGFAAATLPTISNNSATGAVGVPVTHPGIAKGGGMCWSMGGQPLGVGEAGEDIRVTLSDATGGSIRIVLIFWIDELAE